MKTFNDILCKLFDVSKKLDITKDDYDIIIRYHDTIKVYIDNINNLCRHDRFYLIDKIEQLNRYCIINIQHEPMLETCNKFKLDCEDELNKSLNRMPGLLSTMYGGCRDLNLKEFVEINVKNSLLSNGSIFIDEREFISNEISRIINVIDEPDTNLDSYGFMKRYRYELERFKGYFESALIKYDN